MPTRYDRSVAYQEFEGRVRRHRRSELLRAIGALTAHLVDKDIKPPVERLLLPWALAAAAKEAIFSANEYRASGIDHRDLQEICAAFNALGDPILDSDLDAVALHGVFTRMSYEQFPYQSSAFEEITRPYPFFIQGAEETTGLEIISGDLWGKVLGLDLLEFICAAFVLAIGAQKNAGTFNEGWLEQDNFKAILEETSRSSVLRSLEILSAPLEELREKIGRFRSRDPGFRRWDYNPLVATPFIREDSRRYLAPSVHLVLGAISTGGLYYRALEFLASKEDQDAFTRDVGQLFQAYAGRQLSQLPDAQLLPEIHYQGKRSVDWFVIWPDLVLLVEAKATRLTLPARMGQEQLKSDLDRTLGKALRQVDESARLIEEGRTEFAHIPSDRPMMGLILTLEPYYLVNSPLIRQSLPQPRVASLVASARELEHLVSVGQQESVSNVLREIGDDQEKSTWDLGVSIGDRSPGARNPMLDEAWNTLPCIRKGARIGKA